MLTVRCLVIEPLPWGFSVTVGALHLHPYGSLDISIHGATLLPHCTLLILPAHQGHSGSRTFTLPIFMREKNLSLAMERSNIWTWVLLVSEVTWATTVQLWHKTRLPWTNRPGLQPVVSLDPGCQVQPLSFTSWFLSVILGKSSENPRIMQCSVRPPCDLLLQ